MPEGLQWLWSVVCTCFEIILGVFWSACTVWNMYNNIEDTFFYLGKAHLFVYFTWHTSESSLIIDLMNKNYKLANLRTSSNIWATDLDPQHFWVFPHLIWVFPHLIYTRFEYFLNMWGSSQAEELLMRTSSTLRKFSNFINTKFEYFLIPWGSSQVE